MKHDSIVTFELSSVASDIVVLSRTSPGAMMISHVLRQSGGYAASAPARPSNFTDMFMASTQRAGLHRSDTVRP